MFTMSFLFPLCTLSALQNDSPAMKKAVSLLSLTTPNSNRKRRRLKDTLAQLTKETEISPFPPRKRPSAEHSLSIGSLLDISNTPETCKALAGIDGRMDDSLFYATLKQLCHIYILLNINGSLQAAFVFPTVVVL